MTILVIGLLLASFGSSMDVSSRERSLQRKLVAACCWSESLDQHNSGTADKMRAELHELLAVGKSDDEILAAFVAEYGKRVLIEPAGGASVLIYTVPAASALLGLLGVGLLVRRWARPQPVRSRARRTGPLRSVGVSANGSRLIWRTLGGVLLLLPLVLLVNALIMLRELEQAHASFLRYKAAEIAARLELMSPEQVAEEEPALLAWKTYGAADKVSEPSITALLDGQELFRIEDGGRRRFRAWVPYHVGSGTRVARLDLNPSAADFLAGRPRHNLYLAMAVAMVMAALTGYVLWARERQARLERLAELGEMSATLAHEIRNPLGALKGFLQLAHEQTTGEPRTWLETSLEQTDRLEQLVRDLLLYARAPQPDVRPVSWREMEARLRPHAPQARFSGADFRMDTDPDMLEQVMLNLLRNALEAGTEVRVTAEPGRIQVLDNGPGLAPEVRRKLFQPFVTTKAQGTGLGLAIVRNISRALGIRVSLSDMAPSGTCAEIRWDTKN